MKTSVFLDRDGVINRYPGDGKYVTSVKEFRFLPKVKKAIALLTAHKYPIFIISNQAGVGKGLYSQAALDRITEHMLKELSRHKGKVHAVYYCTHRNEDNCSCRKPKTGLIMSALSSLRGRLSKAGDRSNLTSQRAVVWLPINKAKNEPACLAGRQASPSARNDINSIFTVGLKRFSLKDSFFVGDTIRDVQTARAAGCRSILVFSGQEKPAHRDSWQAQPDYVFPDLYQAAEFIVNQKSAL